MNEKMVDVKNSKWLQEMNKLTAEKKKKQLKTGGIIAGSLFVFGIVFFIVAGIAKASFYRTGIGIAGFSIFYGLVLLIGILPMSTRALEKQMKKVLVTEELFEQFENELMSAPKGLVEINKGRVVYTEHFVMSQYENPKQYRFGRILLWDKMDEMDTTMYKTNAQVNGVVTRFYKPGEKKCCQSIEFKSTKDSEAFLTKLTEMKPDIRMR